MKIAHSLMLLAVISNAAMADSLSTINQGSWYKNIDLITTLEFQQQDTTNTIKQQASGLLNEQYQHSIDATDQSTALKSTLGGQLFGSYALYLQAGIEDIKLQLHSNTHVQTPEGLAVFYQNSVENGTKSDLSLFASHKLTPLLDVGFELYHEDYDTQLNALTFDDFDALAEQENYQGNARGARIFAGFEYSSKKSQFATSYAYQRELFRGSYFAEQRFTQRSHQLALSLTHQWHYGLSSQLAVTQRHDRPINGQPSATQKRHIYSALVGVNKLVSDNLSLSLRFERYSFGVNLFSIHLSYQLGKGKEKPRRRKRYSRMMRNPSL